MDDEANGRSESRSRTPATIFQLPAMVVLMVQYTSFPLAEIQSSLWWDGE
jgi:hypothetical protein